MPFPAERATVDVGLLPLVVLAFAKAPALINLMR
jgi:hypothetical protein